MRNPNHDPGSASPPPRPVSRAFSPASWTDIHLGTTDGRDLVLDAIDLGGLRYRDHKGGVRQLWRDFLLDGDVGAIVFVADAADQERFDETARLLGDLLQLLREFETERGVGDLEIRSRKSIPVLALGNKIDSHGAVSEEELRERLGLSIRQQDGPAGENGKMEGWRHMELFMCSAIMGQGYKEGFAWLVQRL